MNIDAATFAAQRSLRFGSANPTRMDCEFWHHMIRSGQGAYFGEMEFNPQGRGGAGTPVWCFKRFGPTRTPLPDGRIVCIGGEHEDFYDPDFAIYNDVIVVSPDGALAIYGYPKEVFPPTDFHTATLCGDRIIIVGRLGYPNERGGADTPVFGLNLSTYAMSRLITTGPSPGWIFGHHARLVDSGRTLRVWGGKVSRGKGPNESHVENGIAADLVLTTLTWQPATLPEDVDAVPELAWPDPWEPMLDPGDVEYCLNRLRDEVPIGHPLFAINVRPWAQAFARGSVLFKVLGGTARVAEVSLDTDGSQRATLPEPRTVFHDSIEDWVRAQRPDSA